MARHCSLFLSLVLHATPWQSLTRAYSNRVDWYLSITLLVPLNAYLAPNSRCGVPQYKADFDPDVKTLFK